MMGASWRKSFSHLGEEQVVAKYLDQAHRVNNFIVDIGAGDGVKMSNTYGFYRQGYTGLAIESDPVKFRKLQQNYKSFTNVVTIHNKVWPPDIEDLLLSLNTPRDFLLLDLDIDSYDYFILEKILNSFTPSVIITEINESIPPPIKFRILPDKNFLWNGGHFFGYSLACILDIVKAFDYSLVELHYNNAILVSNEVGENQSLSIEQAYQVGYRQKPLRKRKFHYNKELDYLVNLEPKQALIELERLFCHCSAPYEISI